MKKCLFIALLTVLPGIAQASTCQVVTRDSTGNLLSLVQRADRAPMNLEEAKWTAGELNQRHNNGNNPIKAVIYCLKAK